MTNKELLIYSISLAAASFPVGAALSAQLPPTNVPYASYRQQMFINGWVRDTTQPSCGSYPEVCTGNAQGSAAWYHPVSKRRVLLHLWPCKHGWCLAAPIIRNNNR